MSIEEIELNWRVGANRYSLVLLPDGRPQLVGPITPETPFYDEPPPWQPPAPRAAPEPAYVPPPRPARRWKPWSEEEEVRIREGFARGETPAAMAKELDRTGGAVRARLVKLGLLDEAAAGLRYPVRKPEAEAPGGEPAAPAGDDAGYSSQSP